MLLISIYFVICIGSSFFLSLYQIESSPTAKYHTYSLLVDLGQPVGDFVGNLV